MEFKSRNSLKTHESHGEVADADTEPQRATESQLPKLWNITIQYVERDVFNGEKSALYYQRLPKITIATVSLPSKKIQEERVSVLFFCYATASEHIPSFVIIPSLRPRCFGRPAVLNWDSTILRIQVRG